METVEMVTNNPYDPLSEETDFFFPYPASDKGSKVETLPKLTAEEIQEEDMEYFRRNLVRGLKISQEMFIERASNEK